MDFFSRLSVVDMSALVVLALGVAYGIIKGLSGVLVNLMGAAVALVAGILYFEPFGALLSKHTRLGVEAGRAMAFTLIVLGVVLITILIRCLFGKIMKISVEQKADRILGVLAGLVFAAVLATMVFISMNMWPHDYLRRKFGEDSIIGKGVLKTMPSLREMVEREIVPAADKVKRIGED